MKYLFIFLPFFAMAQGGDSTLYGVRTQSNTRLDSGFIYVSLDTTLAIKFSRYESNITRSSQLYISDREPKVVESFKHAGAYYELRDNGWYKEIIPDTVPKNREIRIKGDSVFQWVEEPKWISCDQHIGKMESYKREKMDTSDVKLLVWTGCSLTEISATKLSGYNLDRGDLYYDRNGNILRPTKTDFLFVYISDGKWIKPSHVIKEL